MNSIRKAHLDWRLLYFLYLYWLGISAGFTADAQNLMATLGTGGAGPFTVFSRHGVNSGAWLAGGATFAMENPASHSNFPITYNDRSGEGQLNQLGVFFENPVDTAAGAWHAGWRLEGLFGTDSRFTQATGLDDKLLEGQGAGEYNLAIPQAYVEVYAPVGSGLTARLGHFYTIIGHEVVTAPNNFFYSHAYTMQYGEPFTHTGLLFSYALNGNYAINAGTVAGWDNFDKHLGAPSFLGGLSWTDDALANTVSWSVISGDADAGNGRMANRSLSSLVLTRRLPGKLQYVLQQDLGVQRQALAGSADAYWCGVVQYLFYDFSDRLAAGVRGEWFRDGSGMRLNTGHRGDYFAVTAGLNWKAVNWLMLRPELRMDWADSAVPVYADHSGNQQFEIAMDVIVTLW